MKVRVEPLVRALLDGVQEPAEATGRTTGEPAPVDRLRVDLGVVPVFSDERPLLGLAGLIDWRGSGCLSAIVRSGFCSSAPSEQVLLPCDRRLPVDRLVLIGLGPREHYDEARARALAEQSVRVALGLGSPTVLIALPTHGKDRTLTEVAFQALISAIHTIHDREEREPEQERGSEQDHEQAREREPGDSEANASDPVHVDTAPASHDPEQERQDSPEGDPHGEPGATGLHPEVRWWVAADEAVVARLRRVLSGPPRATRGGVGLHT